MNLHGTLATNLKDAITSAERHRGHAVYPDTVTYWADLLGEARMTLHQVLETERQTIEHLIVRLAVLLSECGR
jgi:hypothetical protein